MPPALPQPSNSTSSRSLKTFDVIVQQYGIFFSGYPWQIFGCGTYRTPATGEQAKRLLATYFERLRRSIKSPVAYLAVPEWRTSGLGLPAIALHWHFVMSVPPQHTTTALHNSRGLWNEHYGHPKIDSYDPERSGAHYLAKLAGGSNFEYVTGNLERLPYLGPTDIYEYVQTDPYVPEHAKHLTHGQTLVVCRRTMRSVK
jgi:hypothetical protein